MVRAIRKQLASARADGTVILCAVFLVSGAMGLWVKKAQLELASGYLATARFLGYSRESDLAWWQKLSFFRLDLAIMIVVMPVLLALLMRKLPRMPRSVAAAVLAAMLCTVYFFELQALGSIGRYLTPELLKDAIAWAVDFPESISDYISTRGMLKLVVAIGLIAWLAIMAYRRPRGSAGPLETLAEVGAVTAVTSGFLLALLAYVMPVPTLAAHRTALHVAGEAMWPDKNSFGIQSDASREQLLDLYRHTAALHDA